MFTALSHPLVNVIRGKMLFTTLPRTTVLVDNEDTFASGRSVSIEGAFINVERRKLQSESSCTTVVDPVIGFFPHRFQIYSNMLSTLTQIFSEASVRSRAVQKVSLCQ